MQDLSELPAAVPLPSACMATVAVCIWLSKQLYIGAVLYIQNH